MSDGGGGGGVFDSIQNFGEAVLGAQTFGLTTETGRTITDSLSGETAKRAASHEKKVAMGQQSQREQAMAEQDAKEKGQSKSASMRARQKAMRGEGRGSTILTGDLGAPPAGGMGSGGKTLLGS
jgi:hypothetical protein